MSFRIWLHGLGAAAVSGAAMAVTASFAAPNSVNFTGHGLKAMGTVFVAGGFLGAAAYLTKSPLPPCNPPPPPK